MGESAVLWAGSDGVRLEPDRWLALSGAPSVSYNVILCHGPGDRAALSASAEQLTAAGVPGIVMVAGDALADVQQLAGLSWACIGAVPFMLRPLAAGPIGVPDPDVRRLAGAELAAARRLIADVFELTDEIALVALPADASARPGQSVWGAFDDDGALVSCVTAVAVGPALAFWSLATAPGARRRGHGARLMNTVLVDGADAGLECSVLYTPSSEAGAFYRSIGYRALEHWQLWSRPRWVLGRA
jgi:ribosomal protein S18 acetylase RimI-like enzyme